MKFGIKSAHSLLSGVLPINRTLGHSDRWQITYPKELFQLRRTWSIVVACREGRPVFRMSTWLQMEVGMQWKIVLKDNCGWSDWGASIQVVLYELAQRSSVSCLLHALVYIASNKFWKINRCWYVMWRISRWQPSRPMIFPVSHLDSVDLMLVSVFQIHLIINSREPIEATERKIRK